MDDLPPLYKERLPISQEKFNDLKKICDNGIVPRRFHHEYYCLPKKSKVIDTLMETDEDDTDQD